MDWRTSWRKAAAWSAAGLVLAGAAALLAIHVLVDSDSLRKAAARHRIQLGDVALTLWPVPAVTADRVSMPDAPCCKLLQAERLRADIEIWPLLSGEVRFKRVLLNGAQAGFDDGEQWVVEEAVIESSPEYRDVRIEARVTRHGEPLAIKAEFADLSRLGTRGAATDGRVELAWKRTRANVTGRFPLDKGLAGGALEGELKSESFDDLFTFFGIERGKTAPLELSLEAREAGGALQVTRLAARLGKLDVTGEARIEIRDGKPVFDARLAAGRLDWLRTLVDAGGTLKPKRKDEEVFHRDPVAWRAVTALGALDASRFALDVKSLKLGNGLELTNVRTTMALGDGRLALQPFSANLLGGIARGGLRFDGGKKTLQVKLDAEDLLLERWFRERGSKVPFTGGPMALHADFRLSGETYRDFAASIEGPVRLRMGQGRWDSKVAGEYEGMMVAALAAQSSDEITFECAAADLDFKRGRASGPRLVGARSNVSQLLTGGTIDLREERIDLRGRVKAASGISAGLAMFAGDVQVHGRLARPRVRMDPDGKPAVVARIAAAMATSGASVVGGALLDAAEEKRDPCDIIRPQDVK